MSQVPLDTFDLVKLLCSLKLVIALTGIAPGEGQLFGVIKLMGNYLAACPLYCPSSSPLRAALVFFRTDSFPKPQDSQKFLTELWMLLPSISLWHLWIPAGQETRQQMPNIASKLTLEWGQMEERGWSLEARLLPVHELNVAWSIGYFTFCHV